MLMNLLGKLYLKSIAITGGAGVLFDPDATTEAATNETAEEIKEKVFAPMNLLIDIICYGMAGIGLLVAIKAFVDIIANYPQHDSAAMIGAAKWLVAGMLLGATGILVKVLRTNF